MAEQSVTILGIDCDTTRILYHYLVNNGVPVSNVILETPVSKKDLLKGRIRKLGVWPVIGQLLFIGAVNPLLKKSAAARREAIKSQYGLAESPIPEAKITRVASVNSDACRAVLSREQVSLIIVNGTRIIGKKTLESTSIPFVNIHTGITPLFRGVHGGYWAIATGRKELFGTTIHQVDTGIDTGKVLAQITTTPDAADNFASYPVLQYAICLPTLAGIIKSYFSEGVLKPVPPLTTESRLWYHPTLLGYLTKPK